MPSTTKPPVREIQRSVVTPLVEEKPTTEVEVKKPKKEKQDNNIKK